VKPEVSHLRIFGCPAYIHLPEEKRTKMEPSNMKGVFMGYIETSKAYRIFVQALWRIMVSRDVRFEEDLAARKLHETLPMIERKE